MGLFHKKTKNKLKEQVEIKHVLSPNLTLLEVFRIASISYSYNRPRFDYYSKSRGHNEILSSVPYYFYDLEQTVTIIMIPQ